MITSTTDEAMQRLLDFDRRRYWPLNGWSIRFRIAEVSASMGRPKDIKYSFTLHDIDGTRLLGFDNAHRVAGRDLYDHRHRFRRADEPEPYEFQGADELICDFFDAVEQVCRREGVPFEFDTADVEVELEDDDGTNISD
jgi:hypothetical protein